VKIYVDSYCDIGRQHVVCEDHAISDPKHRAVYVSDGCSSALGSDFGSRFLTLAAARDYDGSPDYTFDHERIVAKAAEMCHTCTVPIEALMATLLVAHAREDRVSVVAWGDGVVAARNRSGFVEFHSIEFPSNAPTYPAYCHESKEVQSYLDSTDVGLRVVYSYDEDSEKYPLSSSREILTGFKPSTFFFPADDYDLVMLLTDGASSFQRQVNGAWIPIPVHEVVEHAMNVKMGQGDFVVRRIRNGFLRRFCIGNGWQHYDDFGVAGVYMEDSDG